MKNNLYNFYIFENIRNFFKISLNLKFTIKLSNPSQSFISMEGGMSKKMKLKHYEMFNTLGTGSSHPSLLILKKGSFGRVKLARNRKN